MSINHSATVMVVEDDAAIRESLRVALEAAGYKVALAANGQEGIEWLVQHPEKPDLILLDLMMPVMDGWEFDAALSDQPDLDRIPVVIVTAFTGNLGQLKHARGIIHKPVNLDTLISTVGKYCTRMMRNSA